MEPTYELVFDPHVLTAICLCGAACVVALFGLVPWDSPQKGKR